MDHKIGMLKISEVKFTQYVIKREGVEEREQIHLFDISILKKKNSSISLM